MYGIYYSPSEAETLSIYKQSSNLEYIRESAEKC